MTDLLKKRLTRTTLIYWALLLYVVAALLWWLISLQHQNQEIRNEKLQLLQSQTSYRSPAEQQAGIAAIEKQARRNTAKYLSEGITFLIVILLGAWVVYRAVRRHFKVQQQQQQFMMAVTHELKTPIAVAKLNLETLQKYSLEPAQQQKLIRTTLDETARLNFLTNNILVSSQLEYKGFNSTKEELNFSALLQDCLSDLQKRFPDRKVETTVTRDLELTGDALLLQMLINNLLENAIKYAPQERPILVELDRQGQQIVLQIADEGPGIPDSEKSKIFSRFYRIGNEETRTAKGTGLGLYLCDKIARYHRARIEVSDRQPRGSIFRVIFAA